MVSKARSLLMAGLGTSDETHARRIATTLSDKSTMAQKVGVFHDAMELPNRKTLTELSVSARERRLRLTFEEFLETVEASGFELVAVDPAHGMEWKDFRFKHIEGSHQDLIEIADGIADQLVTNLGHALEHGIDIESVFNEVCCSNMTKLDADGKPIVNGVTPGYRDVQLDYEDQPCTAAEPGFDPSKPVGKILKPKEFVPADVAAVLAMQGTIES